MEPTHISKSLHDVLESPQHTQQLLESTLTSVRSLIRQAKIDEAKHIILAERQRVPGLKDHKDELSVVFGPQPATTLCERGHVKCSEFVWGLMRWCPTACSVCLAEEEAERRRPYRHRSREATRDALKSIGIPSRFIEATSKHVDTHESVYLTGPKGTGKTHLAAAMVREIVLDRTPYDSLSDIEWVSAPDLLLEIRATFRDGADRSEKGIIEQYSECRLLVLDDLGAEKTTEWSLQTLYTIIDRRYREERQTIITSNLSLDELAEKLDDRIASRLSELCRVVVLTGPDRRTQKKRTPPQG